MNPDSETWKRYNGLRRVQRANNRAKSASLLKAAGIPFETRNEGAHLIIADTWDFWPGTGLWKHRHIGRQGRGVLPLLEAIKELSS